MVWRALGRLILVPLGFVLGAAAAVAILLTLGLERATQAAASYDWDFFDIARGGFDVLKQGELMASIATFVPIFLLLVIGEVARIRSAIYYVFGGGLALAVIPLAAKLGYGEATLAPTDALWQVFATAGFAGGFIYWLIAGRKA